MARFKYIWLLSLMCSSYVLSFVVPRTSSDFLLSNTLDSLRRTLTYMIENKDEMNTDAYFGVQLAQVLLDSSPANDKKIQELRQTADQLLKDGRTLDLSFNNNLANGDYCLLTVAYNILKPEMWKELGNELNETLYCVHDGNDTYISRDYSANNSPDGRESDMCLSQLIDEANHIKSTSIEKNIDCKITKECKELMVAGKSYEYALTHRVIFTLLERAEGCIDRGTVGAMCCDVMKEALLLESKGFPPLMRDLFIEQVLVCALSGYKEFLRSDWIELVLQWQRNGECWGLEETKNKKLYKYDDGRESGMEDYEDGWTPRARRWFVGNRIPRSTRQLGPHHCSSHMTGLAAALLALSARHSASTVKSHQTFTQLTD